MQTLSTTTRVPFRAGPEGPPRAVMSACALAALAAASGGVAGKKRVVLDDPEGRLSEPHVTDTIDAAGTPIGAVSLGMNQFDYNDGALTVGHVQGQGPGYIKIADDKQAVAGKIGVDAAMIGHVTSTANGARRGETGFRSMLQALTVSAAIGGRRLGSVQRLALA